MQRERELSERLRQTETTEPNNSYQIWILRDQIACWQGKLGEDHLDEFKK
jgi:hypothetical protein